MSESHLLSESSVHAEPKLQPVAPPPALDTKADLGLFFDDAVRQAAREHALAASEGVLYYLRGLLVDHTRTSDSCVPLDESITLLLYEARQSHGMERLERMRGVGDGVLYIVGFFRDHLQRRGVGIDYVNALGAEAYDDAARILRGFSANAPGDGPDIFRELADSFPRCAEVLHEVGELLMAGGPEQSSTVRLYERWLRSGSPAAARALGARGIVPLRGDSELN